MSSELVNAKLKDDMEAPPDYSQFAQPPPLRDAYATKDGHLVTID